MGLKINYSEGLTMSKQKLARAEALQAQSQWLDFGRPDLRAVLPGQKETADLSRGDSWALGLPLWSGAGPSLRGDFHSHIFEFSVL